MPRQHQEAIDHAHIARLRRRAADIGELRRRCKVEHLRGGVGLDREHEVVELRKLPILVGGNGAVGTERLGHVVPGVIGVVELVELARCAGEDDDGAVRLAREEEALARRRQGRGEIGEAWKRTVAVRARQHIGERAGGLRPVVRDVGPIFAEGKQHQGVSRLI
jgi:hypothetical protein